MDDPVPVIGWDADRSQWLAVRRTGLGASDVAAVLGFSQYRTPWQVWAEKTNTWRPDDAPSAAADLGNDLEDWLRGQLATKLRSTVAKTEHQLYARHDQTWCLASPDGHVPALNHGVECKTAGLAGGFGPPDGWTDTGIPLGYEFQVRWQMYVMNWPAVEVVALVANQGIRHYTFTRDQGIELDLVTQVSEWWHKHVIEGAEPPITGPDDSVMKQLFPRADRPVIELNGVAALDAWAGYREAAAREKAARDDKTTHAARLKKLLGSAEVGLIEGRPIATWATKNNGIDWERLARDLAQKTGTPLPDIDNYRKPASRVISVKDPK